MHSTVTTTDNAQQSLVHQSLYIAVDLGAGSGRVFLAGLAPGELLLEEVRRFHYPASQVDGHLRWNLPRVFDKIKAGLREAAELAHHFERPIRSIGVDGWGVDYGWVEREGSQFIFPFCSRAAETQE